MNATWKLLSGVLALSLVIGAVIWTLPVEPDLTPTAVRAAGSAVVLDQSRESSPPEPQLAEGQVYASEPSVPTVSPAVRDLPPLDDTDYPLFDREMARKDDFGFVGPDVQGPPWLDPLAALQLGVPEAGINAFTTPLTNWEGMDYGSYPPDTTGDVGPNHYVQAVNGSGGSTVRVFDKSGTILKTFTMESLASTAPCNSGYCDPIVIYDSPADRWFISEFASSSSYPMCLYVSTTPDPMGTWYAYTFDLPYYDYPKYGLWPDAYYMGYNGGATGYRQVFAFDRAAMLAGQPATYQMFSVPYLSGFGFQLVVPASLEGPTPPPAGAPGLFMRPRDTEVHGPAGYSSSDLMEMWAFHVDWDNAANSSLTKLADVQMAEYDCTLCGTGSDWDCMPQPGTTQKLDPIREPLHQPLQYRNWGTYETLVGGFVNDVDGDDHASVRWFEMRKTDGTWSIYQQGTIGGDPQHRSVTSAALDGAGGLALGYTLTGSSTPYYPGIRYAGRRPWDPLNAMAFVDAVAQDGNSSQTANERWGDYSGIGVDPVDDCTFWYTTEYMSGGSSATRVISFRFDPDFIADASPDVVDLCGTTADVVYSMNVDRTCALNGSVTMSTGTLPAGATATWSANPVTPSGSTTLTIGNLGGVAPGTYNIDVIGTAEGSIVRQETVVLNLQSAAPAAATLSSPADGVTDVATDVTLAWATTSGAGNYDIQVATDPGFANVVRSATGLTGTSYTPSPGLEPATVYYWRVRGNNACGSGDYSTTWAFGTVALSCLTYSSTDVPKTISNGQWVESMLSAGESFQATDVNLTIGEIAHGRVGQLDIYIQHPDSTEVELSTGNGGSGDDYQDTVFDDEAVLSIVDASPPFVGPFQPEGSLAALDGKSVNGTWRLRIFDASPPTTGLLNSWGLTLCGTATTADYSDLAGSYGVAWHTGDGALRLGTAWDADTTFVPADDDTSDDGVTFPNGLEAGQARIVRVNVQGTPASGGRWLRLWLDWNGDGFFGDQVDGEQVYDAAVSSGDNDITINVPAGYSQAVSYRARLYDSDTAPSGVWALDGGSFRGASSGEVEDGATPTPTAVTLTRFEASPAAGGIHLEWETATEIDNLGFNLYRRESPEPVSLMLNEMLIASQAPGSPTGAVYAWLDGSVEPGMTYYYELEDIDLHDIATRHGVLVVTAPYLVYLPVTAR